MVTSAARKTSTKPLVISYLRFSRPEQLQGDSQRRQLELSEKWAKQHDLRIDNEISDPGVSAFRGKNSREGNLAVFLKLVEQGMIAQGSVLLVEELDRISRQSPEDALHLFLSIVKSGLKVVTLNTGDVFERGKIDTGELMIAVVKFCTANDESAKKASRLSAAWDAKRRRIGEKPLTRRIPAWLKVSGNRIVVDEAKAAVVRRIFTLAAAGYGLHAIVKKMNSEATGMARAKHFYRSYISKILHNRAAIGEFQPHRVVWEGEQKRREPVGDPVKGYYPAVVKEREFYAAQKALSSRQTMRGPSGKFCNVFAGLLHNVEDGATLQIVDKGNGRCYVSSAALDGRKGAGAAVRFPVRAFEQAMLLRLAHPDLYATNDDRLQVLQSEADAAEARIDETSRKIQQIQESMLIGDGNAASVVALLTKLDAMKMEQTAKHADLVGQLAEASAGRKGAAGELLALIMQSREKPLTHDQRIVLRNAMRRLVERIDCHFIREGRDYIAATMVTLKNGKQFDYSFRAQYVSQMLRDELGHPIPHKGETPATRYEVEIPMDQPGMPIEHDADAPANRKRRK